MELVHEFTMRATVNPPLQSGVGRKGIRATFAVTGGEVEGERINGKVLPIGADWALIEPTGDWAHIDVRVTIQTDDGALIHGEYLGHLEINEKVGAAMTGQSGTEFGDQYFFTGPRLETGDEAYAWVNRTQFVAQGRINENMQVEYQVHRLTN